LSRRAIWRSGISRASSRMSAIVSSGMRGLCRPGCIQPLLHLQLSMVAALPVQDCTNDRAIATHDDLRDRSAQNTLARRSRRGGMPTKAPGGRSSSRICASAAATVKTSVPPNTTKKEIATRRLQGRSCEFAWQPVMVFHRGTLPGVELCPIPLNRGRN
jgi:hypothetical protein